MTKSQSPFDRPIPPDAVCAFCGRNHAHLRRCCVTGTGDFPRRPILCGECLQRIFGQSKERSLPSPASPSMSERDMQHETRRQKALNRLGSDNPTCACCGENDPCCLELHHLEGKDFGAFLVILCRNCHRKLSNPRPSKFGEPPMTLESIGQFLKGLADLLIRIAEKLWEYGEYLIEQARLQMPKAKPSKP